MKLLKYHAINEQRRKLEGQLQEAYARQYHNVSTLGMQFKTFEPPGGLDERAKREFERGQEARFKEFLYWQCETGRDDLHNRIKELFNESLTLEFTGRSSATLYITDWGQVHYTGSGRPGFDEEKAGLENLRGAAYTARANKILKILTWFDEAVNKAVNALPAEWEIWYQEVLDQENA